MFRYRWLLDKGVASSTLDKLLEEHSDRQLAEGPMTTTSPDVHPPDDESTWFVNCTREEAKELLKNRIEGTFLVRPSNKEGCYALTVA